MNKLIVSYRIIDSIALGIFGVFAAIIVSLVVTSLVCLMINKVKEFNK